MPTADYDNSLQQTLFDVGDNGFDLMLGKILVFYFFLKFPRLLLKIVLSLQKCGFCLISAQVSEQFCLFSSIQLVFRHSGTTVMENAVFGCILSNDDSLFEYLSINFYEICL